jgi:thiol-disulfide isomerase/thioredoxin
MRKRKAISYFCLLLVMVIGLMTIVASGGGDGGGSDGDGSTSDDATDDTVTIETFDYESGDICMEDDKPIIRLFSTSTCPHCLWVGDTFEEVVQKYLEEGSIIAHHWEYNTITTNWDDLLTSQVETDIPASEKDVFDTYSGGYVPTFVFGCRYTRVGNGYEAEDDLDAEAAEFEAVIEELLDSIP